MKRVTLSLRRVLLGLFVSGLALSGPACGSKDSANPSVSATAESKSSAEPDVASDDLARLVPFDATVVGGLSSLEVVRSQFGADAWKQIQDGALSDVSSKVGVPVAMLTQLLDAYDGAALFAMGGGRSPKGGVLVRVKDASLVTAALTAAKFEKKAADRWVRTDGGDTIHATLLEKERVVVLANDESALAAVLETKAGKKKPFTESPHFRRRAGDGLSMALDLGALAGSDGAGVAESGSKLLLGLTTDATGPKGGKLDLELTLVGARIPQIGQVVAPRPLSALAALPSGAALGLEVSLQRTPGKTVRDIVTELGKVDGKDATELTDELLRKVLGSSLAELDSVLGDDLAIAVYPSGEKLELNALSPLELGVVLVDVAVKDEAVAKRFVEEVKKGVPPGAGFETTIAGGRLRVFIGHAETVKRLASGGDKLGDSKAFQAAKVGVSKPSQVAMFVDVGAIVKLLPPDAGVANLAQMSDVATLLSFGFKPFDRGLDLAASGSGGAVAVVGILASVAIFGVRSYLGSAKASEAKNTIGALSRAVMGAYEREDASGGQKLCPSAPPVPAAVPRGTKVVASSADGVDYQHPSWKCLRFMMSMPQYYQYEYRVGGPYKGPGRGGPDPGPDGFEISAEGDLDGDGVTSLFTQVGKVVPATKQLQIATEPFIADERE